MSSMPEVGGGSPTDDDNGPTQKGDRPEIKLVKFPQVPMPALFLDRSPKSDRLKTHATLVNFFRQSFDHEFPSAVDQCSEWSAGIHRVATAPALLPPPQLPPPAPWPRGAASASMAASRRRQHDVVHRVRPMCTLSPKYGSSQSDCQSPTGSQTSWSPSSGSLSRSSSSPVHRPKTVYTGKGSVRPGVLGRA